MKNRNSIVVQYIPSSQTQSYLSQGQSQCEKLYENLKHAGKRPIPDCEIGLAIIYCSTEKYCNPDIDIVAIENVNDKNVKIMNSTIIAADTLTQSEEKLMDQNPSVIPDSEYIRATKRRATVKLADTQIFQMNSTPDVPSDAVVLDPLAEAFIPDPKRQKLIDDKIQNSEDKVEALAEIGEQNTQELGLVPVEEILSRTKNAVSEMKNQNLQKARVSRVPQTIASKPSQNSRKRNVENSSDDDDELFNFKEVPKKFKGNNSSQNKPVSRFVYEKPTKVVREIRNSQFTQYKNLTQNTIPLNKEEEEVDLIDEIPRPPSPPIVERWLSRFHKLDIKEDSHIKECDETDRKPNETELWIERVKNNIEVVANLSVKKSRLVDDGTDMNRNTSSYTHHKASNANTTLKNFKCFVKRHNYKSQSRIITTKPYYEV